MSLKQSALIVERIFVQADDVRRLDKVHVRSVTVFNHLSFDDLPKRSGLVTLVNEIIFAICVEIYSYQKGRLPPIVCHALIREEKTIEFSAELSIERLDIELV